MPSKKYEVYAHVTIGMHCVVEAESEEEAREHAEDAAPMDLCWQCSEGCDSRNRGLVMNEWRTSGEFDGTLEIQNVTLLESLSDDA